MYKSLLPLTGLVALTSGLVLYRQSAQNGVEMPDIEAIMSVDESSFKSYAASFLPRGGNESEAGGTPSRWTCSAQALFTWGELDDGHPGLFITNADAAAYRGFYIYHNSCDSIPYKYIWVPPSSTRFVALPPRFEGRITRGVDQWSLRGVPQTLATWFEFSVDRYGWIWGDVSLIRGCDGAVVMWATDGSGAWKGFVQSILENAPLDAYDRKDSGVWVLKASVNWDGSINRSVRDWEYFQVGPEHVYVDDWHGNPVITSTNGHFGTYWPAGRP
ncbi:hypothetical protein DL767_007580 [Monosporascus sp. MG133]|nr:hypothetical protein DL767_007580 [Monosporascus sp. MG133]